MVKYSLTICGGTFDLLHKGHKDFLKKILKVSEKVFLGLTSDKYVNQNKPDSGIASFYKRKKELIKFLGEIEAQDRVEIKAIDDLYGPLLDPNFKADALAVTEDSYKSGLEINSKRKENSLNELEILKIPTTKDIKGKTLSTTRIKQGFVNKGGKLLLTSFLRHQLKKPLGDLLEDIPKDVDLSKTITVGDITTEKFLKKGLKPKLSVIDFLVNRKPIPHKIFRNTKVIVVNNPAGSISFDLFEKIKNSLKDSSRKILVVKGEEDLSVLPALIFAPLGNWIFYGQPGKGLVRVEINRKNKKRAQDLLNKFGK